MKLIKLMIFLVFILIGLIQHHHVKSKPEHQPPQLQAQLVEKTPVNQELLHNAERLTETLRKCQQTAQSNRQTK